MLQKLGSYALLPVQLTYDKKEAANARQILLNKDHGKEVSITTEDKIKLNAMLIQETHSPLDSYRKLIIRFGGKDEWYEQRKDIFPDEVQKTHQLGYDILFFNYRGVGKSKGNPTPEGLINDGRAVLNFAILKGYKTENITIHGFSLGGAIATKALASEGKKFKNVKFICDRTFSSIKNVINNMKTWKIVKLFLSFLLFICSWNIDITEDWKELKCSKIALVSSSDQIIPIKASLAYALDPKERKNGAFDLQTLTHAQNLPYSTQEKCHNKLLRQSRLKK